MSKQSEPVALFDVDGTLADYHAAMQRDLSVILTPDDYQLWTKGIETERIKAAIKLIRSQPNWWINLAKLQDGFDLLQVVRDMKFSINILTKGPFNHPNSWSEKVEWCRKYVSDAAITITENKSLVYGKVLVDDWPPCVIDWLAFRPRGLVILPDRPWNQDLQHKQVIRYKNNLSEIKTCLIKLNEQR